MDLEFRTLPMPKPAKGMATSVNVFVRSPRLREVIATLTDRELYGNHPTILLVKCSNLVAHHEEVVQYFVDHWKDVWCAVSFNGDGCLIYSSALMGKSNVYIDGIRGQPGVDQGVFRFKGLGIMKALSHLKTLGSTRIAIASGLMAGRCINFMDDEYDWHVTDEYIDPPESAATDTVLQSLRICGIHQNPTPLIVWCDEGVKQDIMFSYINIIKYIRGIKDRTMSVFEVLSETRIHNAKMGKRKLCKIRRPFQLTTDESEDNMHMWSSGTGEEEVEEVGGKIKR
jgi:hypothetical protein